jgi:hypothetical protein
LIFLPTARPCSREFSLTALAYNLWRVLNLVGFIELMAALTT